MHVNRFRLQRLVLLLRRGEDHVRPVNPLTCTPIPANNVRLEACFAEVESVVRSRNM
jgi:hypothetical protein